MTPLAPWPRTTFGLVLLLAAAATTTTTTTGERRRTSRVCDLEALRCDIICAFESLAVPCQRCGQRRPMRFGKRGMDVRKRPGDAKRGPWKTKRHSSLDESQEAIGNEADRAQTSYLDPALGQEAGTVGEARLRTKGRARQQSGLFATKSPLLKELLANASSFFIPQMRQEEEEKEEEDYRRPHNHRSHANLRITPEGLFGGDAPRDEEKFDYVDTLGYDFERRNDLDDASVAQPPSAFSVSRVKRQSGRSPTGGAPGPLRRVRRYFSARDMVEGLLELLGLEKLPIDPRIYGCHHLFDQYYG
ncbi:uncharacterized protein LOC143019447 [Oratosquilla oratoria]|uniref:uncharacterized protein LOC143019447 n=1 Tax=Oratosquilla oratoria TaxID=337810 RepID=UPI003F766F26